MAGELVTYITRHKVVHGEPGKESVEYPEGSEFRSPDPKVIASLRAAKAIALPLELETPESVAEREARLRGELEAARAELEQLRASASTPATQAEKKASAK